MPEFNLVDQPWILCLLGDGGKPQELSLRDTLTGAREIRELFDNSPLVTVSLHRLLLAILHRNFGPASFGEWKELWQCGQWDSDKLSRYFDEWTHRFNLFDKERPFYQVLRMQNAKGKDVEPNPVALLAHEAATGNNATLFDHSFEKEPEAYSAATAARYLITRQAFSIGFGRSDPFYLQDSALVRGFSVLALGNNLFETLTLNLLPYNIERPISHQGEDKPVWEQNDPAKPDKDGTVVRGWLDCLTWQSRRIHLVPEDDGSVRYCQLQQNLKLADTPLLLDPFKCYQRKDSQEPFQPLGLRPDRALWRDSHILFQQIGEQGAGSKALTKRPEIFNHLAQIEMARRRGEIEAQPGYAFAAYGFATEIGKAASVIFWARERLPLPLSYLIEPQLVDELSFAIDFADKRFFRALHKSLNALAEMLVVRDKVSDLVKSFAADEFYWSRLEQSFKKLLTDLPNDFQQQTNGHAVPDERAMKDWVGALQQTSRGAIAKAINSLSGSARDLKAAAQAEKVFGAEVKKLCDDYPHYFTQPRRAGGNR
jgi:CRISPR system Cascade subunit CasA